MAQRIPTNEALDQLELDRGSLERSLRSTDGVSSTSHKLNILAKNKAKQAHQARLQDRGFFGKIGEMVRFNLLGNLDIAREIESLHSSGHEVAAMEKEQRSATEYSQKLKYDDYLKLEFPATYEKIHAFFGGPINTHDPHYVVLTSSLVGQLSRGGEEKKMADILDREFIKCQKNLPVSPENVLIRMRASLANVESGEDSSLIRESFSRVMREIKLEVAELKSQVILYEKSVQFEREVAEVARLKSKLPVRAIDSLLSIATLGMTGRSSIVDNPLFASTLKKAGILTTGGVTAVGGYSLAKMGGLMAMRSVGRLVPVVGGALAGGLVGAEWAGMDARVKAHGFETYLESLSQVFGQRLLYTNAGAIKQDLDMIYSRLPQLDPEELGEGTYIQHEVVQYRKLRASGLTEKQSLSRLKIKRLLDMGQAVEDAVKKDVFHIKDESQKYDAVTSAVSSLEQVRRELFVELQREESGKKITESLSEAQQQVAKIETKETEDEAKVKALAKAFNLKHEKEDKSLKTLTEIKDEIHRKLTLEQLDFSIADFDEAALLKDLEAFDVTSSIYRHLGELRSNHINSAKKRGRLYGGLFGGAAGFMASEVMGPDYAHAQEAILHHEHSHGTLSQMFETHDHINALAPEIHYDTNPEFNGYIVSDLINANRNNPEGLIAGYEHLREEMLAKGIDAPKNFFVDGVNEHGQFLIAVKGGYSIEVDHISVVQDAAGKWKFVYETYYDAPSAVTNKLGDAANATINTDDALFVFKPAPAGATAHISVGLKDANDHVFDTGKEYAPGVTIAGANGDEAIYLSKALSETDFAEVFAHEALHSAFGIKTDELFEKGDAIMKTIWEEMVVKGRLEDIMRMDPSAREFFINFTEGGMWTRLLDNLWNINEFKMDPVDTSHLSGAIFHYTGAEGITGWMLNVPNYMIALYQEFITKDALLALSKIAQGTEWLGEQALEVAGDTAEAGYGLAAGVLGGIRDTALGTLIAGGNAAIDFHNRFPLFSFALWGTVAYMTGKDLLKGTNGAIWGATKKVVFQPAGKVLGFTFKTVPTWGAQQAGKGWTFTKNQGRRYGTYMGNQFDLQAQTEDPVVQLRNKQPVTASGYGTLGNALVFPWEIMTRVPALGSSMRIAQSRLQFLPEWMQGRNKTVKSEYIVKHPIVVGADVFSPFQLVSAHTYDQHGVQKQRTLNLLGKNRVEMMTPDGKQGRPAKSGLVVGTKLKKGDIIPVGTILPAGFPIPAGSREIDDVNMDFELWKRVDHINYYNNYDEGENLLEHLKDSTMRKPRRGGNVVELKTNVKLDDGVTLQRKLTVEREHISVPTDKVHEFVHPMTRREYKHLSSKYPGYTDIDVTDILPGTYLPAGTIIPEGARLGKRKTLSDNDWQTLVSDTIAGANIYDPNGDNYTNPFADNQFVSGASTVALNLFSNPPLQMVFGADIPCSVDHLDRFRKGEVIPRGYAFPSITQFGEGVRIPAGSVLLPGLVDVRDSLPSTGTTMAQGLYLTAPVRIPSGARLEVAGQIRLPYGLYQAADDTAEKYEAIANIPAGYAFQNPRWGENTVIPAGTFIPAGSRLVPSQAPAAVPPVALPPIAPIVIP